MIGKKIIESEPIQSVKVKEALEEFSQENELNYEQNITLNHLSRFKRYSVEDSEKIISELNKEVMSNKKNEKKIKEHLIKLGVSTDKAETITGALYYGFSYSKNSHERY